MKTKNTEKTLPDDLDQFSFQGMDSSPSFQMSRSKRNHQEFSLKDQFPEDHPKLFGGNDESLNSKKGRSQKNLSTSVIVHIKLGKDLTKEIKCDLDDDVLGLAQTFCKENNLAPDAVPVIINMIKKQFAVILQRMKSQTNKSKGAEASFEGNQSARSPHFKESQKNVQRFEGPSSVRETDSEITDSRAQEKSRVIGKLDVAISPTQTMELILYEGQDPVETAYRFCKENKLQKSFVEVLAKKLDELRKAHSYQKLKQQRRKREQEIGGERVFQKEIRQTFGKKGKGSQSREVSDDSKVEEKEIKPKNIEYKNPFQLKPGNTREILGSPNFAENVGKEGSNEENDRSQLEISLEDDEKKEKGRGIKEEALSMEEILPKEDKEEAGERGRQNDLAGAYERWAGLIKNKQIMNMGPHTGNKGAQPPSSALLAGLTAAQQDRSKSQNAQKENLRREVSPLSGTRMLKTKEGAFVQTIENGSPRANKKRRPMANDKLHKLYYDGLANKEMNEKKNSALLTKKQQEEEKELTFQPNVGRSPPKYERAEKSPGGTMTIKHHKLTELQYLQQKQDTFTFKPYISPRSLELVANRSKSQTPVSRKLNMDDQGARDPNNKKDNLELKMPEKVENPLKNKKKQKELVDRLMLEGKYKEEKLVRQRAAENNGLDPKTGQRLYHPVIPHDQYYHKLKQMDDEKSRSKMNSRSQTPRNGDSHISSTFKTASQHSNSKSLLREVFDKLDSDHDGYISAKEIDLSQIDTNILEALLDLMDFLENNQSRINFDGFLLALDGLGIEEKVLKATENEQILDLSPKTNVSAKFQLFRHEESPGSSGRMVETEPDLWRERKMLKMGAKRSDFSTASSNFTEKSGNKITKHYRELLEKQGGKKIY